MFQLLTVRKQQWKHKKKKKPEHLVVPERAGKQFKGTNTGCWGTWGEVMRALNDWNHKSGDIKKYIWVIVAQANDRIKKWMEEVQMGL